MQTSSSSSSKDGHTGGNTQVNTHTSFALTVAHKYRHALHECTKQIHTMHSNKGEGVKQLFSALLCLFNMFEFAVVGGNLRDSFELLEMLFKFM